MVKLVPHYIISKSFANHPLIEMLSKQGLFDFDASSNIAHIACDLHYVIPKHFAGDPVIELMSKHSLFDFEAEKNTLYLPVNPMVAHQLGVSPFSSQPLDSYMKGIGVVLKRFRDSRDFVLARKADEVALKRLEGAVNHFQAALVDGLKTGRLFLTPPLAGHCAPAARSGLRQVLGGFWDNITAKAKGQRSG